MPTSAKHKDTKNWAPDSWQKFPIQQQPDYPDQAALESVQERLSRSVPLVTPDEINSLRIKLKEVAEGRAFLLQGGDCAESFAEFNQDNLKKYFRVMLQMTVALMYGAGKPVVKVGRIAGQFAKPRSAATEAENGLELPSYRGDMVNGIDFEKNSRAPDPQRLIEAYHQSCATLNYIRALAHGGYASLRNVNEWNKEFASECKQRNLFEELVGRINDSFAFMNAWGLDLSSVRQFQEADFFTSHEALLLGYEQSLTRYFKHEGRYYDCSAHLLWIGDRTRKLQLPGRQRMKLLPRLPQAHGAILRAVPGAGS
jgi:3-deoxy-7-phosphoheptulonate synthase